MRKWKGLFLILIIACTLAGCKHKTKETAVLPEKTTAATQTPEPSVAPSIEPTENHDGQVKSKFSGLWIDQNLANKRPYAIMFNNIRIASPQSGTSEASILYEAVVEGGITRMMGIFEDFDADRIGSTRSARHYFVSFADEYDAIYVHYGQTKYATAKIAALGVNNLSGLEGVGNTVFYRDHSIRAPHNAFASYKGIIAGTKQKGYRTELKPDYENHYTFYDEDTDLTDGMDAGKVSLGFSNYTTPYLVYHPDDKLYYRFQFGQPHIDYNTKKQLAFKNIIVQYVKEWNIDKKGYQTMDIENSSGKGYYITNGKAVDITWKKNESTKRMHYYDKDGNELAVNAGKTYIAIFPESRADKLKISAN